MDFGDALRALKQGKLVTRSGWNGTNMWLVLILPGSALHAATHNGPAGDLPMMPCIGMRTAAGGMQPGWLASQADMLAEDWEVLS